MYVFTCTYFHIYIYIFKFIDIILKLWANRSAMHLDTLFPI